MLTQEEKESRKGRDSKAKAALIFLVQVLLGSAILLIIFHVFMLYKYGGYKNAVSFVTQDGLYVREPVVSLGQIEPGRTYKAVFRVANYSDRPLRIVGSDSSCSCSTVERLPKRIPPGVDNQIEVNLNPGGSGKQALKINLYTDDPSHPRIPLTIESE